MDSERVLCAASAYTEKYFFNEAHKILPEDVQDELKKLAVIFTNEIGGILTIGFDADGEVSLEIGHDDGDYLYDEIEAELAARAAEREHEELFAQLGEYYRQFVMAGK